MDSDSGLELSQSEEEPTMAYHNTTSSDDHSLSSEEGSDQSMASAQEKHQSSQGEIEPKTTSSSQEEIEPKTTSSSQEEKMASEDEEEYDWEDDGTRSMTRKEYAKYVKQVTDSHGFEVEAIPDVAEFHQIMPLNLNKNYQRTADCESYAMRAIDHFNHYQSVHQIDEGELEFDKLEKAMGQLACGMLYYLTFTANNLKEGKLITYQSLVEWQGSEKFEVLSFRRKPSGSVGADVNIKWFWKEDGTGGCNGIA